MNIHILKPVGDNYIYILETGNNKAVVVDPGTAVPVLNFLSERDLELAAILLTHHHGDHTAGTGQLKDKTNCRVYASSSACYGKADSIIGGNDRIELDSITVHVVGTPGHTADSVCYLAADKKQKALFTGDTLFAGGCGRLFECDGRTMYESLEKLSELEDKTLVYPGHDYTMENYRFGAVMEPDNTVLTERIKKTAVLLSQGKTAVPTSIKLEKETNIFLRTGSASVIRKLKMYDSGPHEIFAALRKLKDRF